ncbi:MAG: sialate O-acetylesterase [Akkermansiaceae bacterium]
MIFAAVTSLLLTGAHARTWTSADGSQTFDGELNFYDAGNGKVTVTLTNGKRLSFIQDKLSEDDIAYLKKNGTKASGFSSSSTSVKELPDVLPDPDGKEADMSKPVQVYILLGQSNMLGFGKAATLQEVAKGGSYPYLVDDAGAWTVRKDVRNVRVMCSGNGPAKDYTNDWMTIQGNIGPEIGIGHYLGHVTDAPVMILKSCIGNRSLGWDLLPPGSVPYEHGGKTQPGYRGTPDDPGGDTGGDMSKGWYAGCQYDGDIAAAKKVLENLDKYYPGAKEYEVAGFFWWQGDKDMRNAAHFEQYEKNLIQLIKALRKDFDAPEAQFVSASLGQTKEGSKGGDGVILDAMKAVSKNSDPELKGKVGFVYSNPLSKGGSSSGHYSGNPETYMNIGEAMGKAMVELLQRK